MAETQSLRLHGLVRNGEYSSIFLAQRNKEAGVVVVKSFNRAFVRQRPEVLRRVLREKWALETLGRLPHPFIVAKCFSHIDNRSVFLGMENVGGGDMFTVLQSRGAFRPRQALSYMGEICLALGHVHSFDIMYRDLKVRAPCPRAMPSGLYCDWAR